MVRFLLALIVGVGAFGAAAQDAPARYEPDRSEVAAEGTGLRVEIGLSAPVPWRVRLLDGPPRLVVEFRDIAWGPEPALGGAEARFATAPSRLVLGLPGPMRVTEAAMAAEDTPPLVTLRLVPTDAARFAELAEADPAPPPAALVAAPGPFVVVLDPGHGGRDPGAEREGARESDLMLALARELVAAVNRTEGMRAVLTREDDSFVPLSERMSRARAAGADVLVSLHADALPIGAARGASIYTLSEAADDAASRRMVERHERGDLLAGVDLTGQDDTVATVLMDLARLRTGPASDRLAEALVAGLSSAGAPLNSRPRREAPLAVLNAADFPSVLVETGFLSSDADRARLSTPEGRGPIVEGLLAGLKAFAEAEATRAR